LAEKTEVKSEAKYMIVTSKTSRIFVKIKSKPTLPFYQVHIKP